VVTVDIIVKNIDLLTRFRIECLPASDFGLIKKTIIAFNHVFEVTVYNKICRRGQLSTYLVRSHEIASE
jgi:hypothetical protein